MNKILVLGGSHEGSESVILAAVEVSNNNSIITLFLPEMHKELARDRLPSADIKTFVHQALGLKDIAFIIEAVANHDRVIISDDLGEDIDTKKAIKVILSEISRSTHVSFYSANAGRRPS